jgi:hypothetical protein
VVGVNAGVVPAATGRLLRVRSGVRAVLALGVAASVMANVLAAEPSVPGRVIAAWPPVALLLTVELVARVPVTSRALSGLRVVTTAAVAAIAAWVSYWHMVEVAAAHGEQTTSAHLLPVSVDGLVVVASVCLVEIGARLRADAPAPAPVPAAVPAAAPAPAPVPAPARGGRPGTGDGPGRARALRAQGLPVVEVAARVGVSDRTVRRWLSAGPDVPDTAPVTDVPDTAPVTDVPDTAPVAVADTSVPAPDAVTPGPVGGPVGPDVEVPDADGPDPDAGAARSGAARSGAARSGVGPDPVGPGDRVLVPVGAGGRS